MVDGHPSRPITPPVFVITHVLCILFLPPLLLFISVFVRAVCGVWWYLTEQRKVCAQSAALVSPGSVHAALCWALDGIEPANSSLPAVPTPWVDLEAYAGETMAFALKTISTELV